MSDDKPKTNGRNNRRAGNGYEVQIVKKLKPLYPNIGTSRANSRSRDNLKVDLINCDESKFGRIPYNIQCKNLAKHCDYAKILNEMPKDGPEVNVIFHKQTKKADNGRFMKVGEFAILKLDDFYYIMKRNLELEDEVKAWSNIM